MMKKNNWIKLNISWWLVGILVVVFVLRFPSLFEPYWYSDEGITMVVGQVWRNGGVIYRDIQDNKPPLLYFLAGLVNGNLMFFKLILMWWVLGTVGIFFLLAKKIFNDKLIVLLVSLFFGVMLSIPLWEGNLVNGEIFMLGPVVVAMLLLSKIISSKLENIILFLVGFLFGIGFLFKHPAVMDMTAGAVFLGIINCEFEIKREKLLKQFLNWFRSVVWLGLGFLMAIGLVLGYFAWHGAVLEFVQSVFLNNFVYVSRWAPISLRGGTGAFGGSLWERLIVLILVNIFLWKVRKRLEKGFLFVAIWFIWSLFGATLSGRPYPHYLLQAVPAGSLLMGYLVFSVFSKGRSGFNKLKLWVTIGLFILFGLTYFRIGYWRYPVIDYYMNFSEYILGNKSEEKYWLGFDEKVKGIYDVSAWLRGHMDKGDKVFLWTDDPQVFVLSNRLPITKYVMAYHVKDFDADEKTFEQLQNQMPKVIVFDSGVKMKFLLLNKLLNKNYKQVEVLDRWRIYERRQCV